MDDVDAGTSPSPAKDPRSAADAEHQPELDGDGAEGTDATVARKRRRGSRGGQRRRKATGVDATSKDGNGDLAPGMAPASASIIASSFSIDSDSCGRFDRSTPVILVSSDVLSFDDAVGHGANGFVRKGDLNTRLSPAVEEIVVLKPAKAVRPPC